MKSTLLIRRARVDGQVRDVWIEGNRFGRIEEKVAPDAIPPGTEVLDAEGMALVPSFANVHCHAAMVLMRGMSDDRPLYEWLTQVIWPMEAKLTPEQVYWGMLYGCQEMIRSGVTAVMDMYWHGTRCMQAAFDSGMRACITAVVIAPPERSAEDCLREVTESQEAAASFSERISVGVAPHAVYTTSPAARKALARFAEEHDMIVHMHLSETRKENADCLAATGLTPTALLESEGVLSNRFIGAHGVWLSDEDRAILARRGASIAHCPKSNCKLGSGLFDAPGAWKAGIRVGLGTDGASSNNRYDMFSEMSAAALLQKVRAEDPTVAPADEILRAATSTGFDMLGLDAGRIATGKLADALLLDLNAPLLAPGRNMTSDLVYAATPECVDTTICNGKVLMRHRRIPGEDEVRKEFLRAVDELVRS